MNSIQTEQEGVFETTKLVDIFDYLHEIAELSNGFDDFLRKLEYGLLDESRHFKDEDKTTLDKWYYNEYLKM